MIGRRTLVEVLHILVSVAGAWLLGYGAIWSLPHAAGTIWPVAFGMMAVLVAMSIRPLLLAWEADRKGRSADG